MARSRRSLQPAKSDRLLATEACGEAPPAAFDVARIRADFPILKQRIHGRPLVYLDNAATSQKPQIVLDAMTRFYTDDCANIRRGAHTLSERATQAYEDARASARRFLNAREAQEIIFVRGATEAINLVASSYAGTLVADDEIVISTMEHHSNIVPWQMLRAERGVVLRVVPVDDAGALRLDMYEQLLGPRTKLVAITHVSNVLGTVNPVQQIIQMAQARNVPVLVDGAQAAPHLGVDVQALDCDFYACSGHKLYGPTGIGILYGKAERLEAMRPYQGGGGMIDSVTWARTAYAATPFKFEAGTPNIAGAVGLGAALDYVSRLGLGRIAAYEQALLAYAGPKLAELPGVRLVGTAEQKACLISFVINGIHPHDVATVLDSEGIAIRAGHHCAQPLMARFGIAATARASFACYNTREEIDALIAGLHKVLEVLG